MDSQPDDIARRALLSSALRTDDFTPASSLVRAEFAARSHPGRSFRENEDHFLVFRLDRRLETLLTSLVKVDVPYRFEEHAYAAVVADGIGAGGAGALAARLAVSTLADLELRFGQWNMRIDPDVASEIIDRGKWFYRRTHEAVLRWYNAHVDFGRMAATLTGIYSAGSDLFVASVGHSRCYVLRKGRLTQLTLDQTLRQRFADSSQPTAVGRGLEDVHHILTSTIGADIENPAVTVEHFRLMDDDSILLCTNGLTDNVSDSDIADTLASRRSLQEQCDLLVDAALANGGTDNVTVVLGHYQIPALSDEIISF